jgi:predicted AAA+ superfamily ATPase
MYHRSLNLSKSQSFFLFGPRGTGKSELLRSHFEGSKSIYIDLLDPELALKLAAYPNELHALISPSDEKNDWIIIDEIQKVPVLLDIVHQEISKKTFKFALTGSSARKLKRGASNLLAGRAVLFSLFPLTYKELGKDFILDEVLTYGSLPELYSLDSNLEKTRYLKAYANTYLKEEIQEEQIVRQLPPFKRFLDIVGSNNSEIVNFSNIARDINSDAKAVQRYYEILEDTLLGFFLPSYETSIRKQQKKSKKFYFFDNGVARVLAGKIDIPVQEKTYEYGLLFESYIVNEIHRLLTYREQQFKLSFLRISDTLEIDLIIEKANGDLFLCEIKSTKQVDERAAKSLNTLKDSFKNPKLRIISQDIAKKQYGEVLALNWKEALEEICGE